MQSQRQAGNSQETGRIQTRERQNTVKRQAGYEKRQAEYSQEKGRIQRSQAGYRQEAGKMRTRVRQDTDK